jgi:hypothetical protein
MDLAEKWYNNIRQNWREASAEESFKKHFTLNLIVNFIIYMSVVQWLKYNSQRSGTMLNDPIYTLLTPYNFSPFIFFFTYTSTIFTFLYLVQYPHLLMRAFAAFAAIFVLRAVCIFLIPLAPSPGMLPLIDPCTNFMANEQAINNDLFFSGHVSDIAFYFFIVGTPWLKRYMLVSTLCVATMLVWQRVHYSLDVAAAPVFAYFCYWAIVEKDFILGAILKKSADEKNAHSPAAE